MYGGSADVLALCTPLKDDLAAILDPDTGYAPRMRQLCTDQIADLDPTDDATQIQLLRLEQNTWSLLQAVTPARKTEPPHIQPPSQLLQENPYTPTQTLAQSIIASSPLLTELIVVREWLHDTAPNPIPPEPSTGYWKFTKHTVMQGLRTGKPTKEGIVTEMDPDATTRGRAAAGQTGGSGAGAGGTGGSGRAEPTDASGSGPPSLDLAPDDASYEKALLQALYAYIRAGRLEDAVDVCRKAHQPWRAASLRGSLLFQWKAISTATIDFEDEDEDDDDDENTSSLDDETNWSGNRNRRLWKSTCLRAATGTALSDAERLLYASIAPSPLSIHVLKTACRTWEDHLWAEISVLCEEKVSKELALLEGKSWWEGDGLGEGDKDSNNKDDSIDVEGEEERNDNKISSDKAREEEWAKEVRDTLEKLKSVRAPEGAPADHAFHSAQLCIILGRTDQLLESFAAALQDGVYTPGSFEYKSITRFFTHLILFLTLTSSSSSSSAPPPRPTQIILETYLSILEASNQRDLIAMYAKALGDNAVERYAEFLVNLGLGDTTSPSGGLEERREALGRARESGLDVARVAVVVAERSVEKALKALPHLQTPLPSITQRQPPANPDEMLLLRSIEWTTFMESTFNVALEQANVILRYFLCTARTHLARSLMDQLPPQLALISDPEETATEYLHYRQFFAIWDTFAAVVECEAKQNQPDMGREAKAAWAREYRLLIDQAYDQVVKLLTTEWLVSDVEAPGGDRRRRELIRIRQIYIPELVLRLHALLFSSRKIAPENMKRVLDLTNVVADSRYRLYEDFMSAGGNGGRTVADYLSVVREAVLGGLENGGSEPLRSVLAVGA